MTAAVRGTPPGVLARSCVQLTLFCLLAGGNPAPAAFAQGVPPPGMAASAPSPCLQALNDQKAEAASAPKKEAEAPNWFSRNAGALLGVAGGALGAVAGKTLCKDPAKRASCMALGAVGGALVGSAVGKLLSDADKKRYQEATYKVALTGRPQSLAIDKGCMVVEPGPTETIENRQFDLALGPGVAPPQKLRSVAEPYVRPSPATLAAAPAAPPGAAQVAANAPSFVMGSTDAGKYLLLGREDPEQGFVGAGYVDARGWVAAPESTPASIDANGGQPSLVKVGVEVPCRQISTSIRVEASNKTETYPGKVCRLPNGVAESE